MLKWLRALEPTAWRSALPVFAGISVWQSIVFLLLLHGYDSVQERSRWNMVFGEFWHLPVLG
jgi:hypothetical protein